MLPMLGTLSAFVFLGIDLAIAHVGGALQLFGSFNVSIGVLETCQGSSSFSVPSLIIQAWHMFSLRGMHSGTISNHRLSP
jgi:hypothetical protein